MTRMHVELACAAQSFVNKRERDWRPGLGLPTCLLRERRMDAFPENGGHYEDLEHAAGS